MLLQGTAALSDAADSHRALPAFSAYNLEMVQAIVAASERTGLPVIINAGASAFRHGGRTELARLTLDAAVSSDTPVGVHLDHSRSLEEIFACLELGYTSVMFDGSDLAFADNVRTTRHVVNRAHQMNAWVEAELVGVTGDEDVSTNAVSNAMTDPALAEEFVAATGVDALSVAIGNVHGFSSTPAVIDLDRLDAIGRRVNVPLVLHGASGLPDEVVLACLDRRVAKVNVNTELRRAYLEAVEEDLSRALETSDLVAVLGAAREAVNEVATRILLMLARAE
jgi:fructose-bisphosphate aldolase class II/tagatose 1,6-diphosphate aldolase GatY/KbaY